MVVITHERDVTDERHGLRGVGPGDKVRIDGKDTYIFESSYGRNNNAVMVDGEEYVLGWVGGWSLRPINEKEDRSGETFVTCGGEGTRDIEELVVYEEEDLLAKRRQYVLDYLSELTQYPKRWDRHRGEEPSDYAYETMADFMKAGKLPEVGKWVDETRKEVLGEPADWHEEMFGEEPVSFGFEDLEPGDRLEIRGVEKLQERADREHYKPAGGLVMEVGTTYSDGDIRLVNPATGDPDAKTVGQDHFEGKYVLRAVKTGEHFEPDEYFNNCFMGMLLNNGYIHKSEEELLDRYRDLASAKNPYKNSRIQDGSKGQWNAAMRLKLTGLRWLLGADELDEEARKEYLWGEPPEEDETEEVAA